MKALIGSIACIVFVFGVLLATAGVFIVLGKLRRSRPTLAALIDDVRTDPEPVEHAQAFAIPAGAELTDKQAQRIWATVQAAIDEDRAAGRDPVLDEVPAQRAPDERGGVAQYPPFNPGGGGR